jgi:hypothetical protein
MLNNGYDNNSIEITNRNNGQIAHHRTQTIYLLIIISWCPATGDDEVVIILVQGEIMKSFI